MIQETQVTLRKQTPSAPNEWLYQSTFEMREKEITLDDGTTDIVQEEVEKRQFSPSAYLGKEDNPWKECTNAERVAWEEAHKEEPIEEAL